MQIKDDKTIKEIKDYCRDNGIKDVNAFVLKMIRKGFTVEKFGEKPNVLTSVTLPVVHEEKDSMHIKEPKVSNAQPEMDNTREISPKKTTRILK